MQNWKTEALLVLALSLLLVNDGSAVNPSEGEVSSAIKEAKSKNAAKRLANIHNRARRNALEGGVRSKCPGLLSNYHGTAEAYNEANVVIAEDTLLATKLLMNKGYTLLQLQTPAVTAMFQSQIGCSVPTVSCDPNQKYRTIDGSCNNLNNPTWGMAGTREIRDLDEVAYDDGLGLPCTKSVGGGQLPSPRKISNTVNNQDNDIFSDRLSAMVFAWGQFLDHDIALTPEAELVDNCCASSEANNEHCFNIEIEDDTDMIQNGADCMPFTRSAAAPVCGPGRREQPNSITHYIDSSNIYGSSPEKLAELRIENTGFLRMKKITTRGVGSYWRLPDDDTPDVHLCEKDEENGFSCSLAGDGRVNDVPTLTSMHQLGVKEHNRIASKLKKYFKDPEVLFQETRKIVMAEFQHITYNGFLPKIFSPDKMAEFGLWSTATYRYNESTKAILSNEMGLAFRMHSLIPSDIKILTQDFNPVVGRNGEIDPDTDKPADDTFFKMDMTYFHKKVGKKRKSRLQGLNGLLYYSAATPAQAMDRHLVDSVRNKLFKDTDTNTALDLAALNIQRGRDHGLPSYNEYRIFCKLSTGPITCDDLTDHDDATIELLRTAYNNECNDIDFWLGAYTEKPSPGAVVGPLLLCVLGRQFHRFKYGDRFWYQNADAGFTPAQLVEIQKASLARLLCDNMEFKKVAPDSFAKPDRSDFVPCSKIPKVKLGLFKRSPLQDQDSSSSTDKDSSREDSSEDDSDSEEIEFIESQEDSSSDDSSSS